MFFGVGRKGNKREKLKPVDFLSVSPRVISDALVQFDIYNGCEWQQRALDTIRNKKTEFDKNTISRNDGLDYFSEVIRKLIEARDFIGENEIVRNNLLKSLIEEATAARSGLEEKVLAKTGRVSPENNPDIINTTKKKI